jgi:hypothetical protein
MRESHGFFGFCQISSFQFASLADWHCQNHLDPRKTILEEVSLGLRQVTSQFHKITNSVECGSFFGYSRFETRYDIRERGVLGVVTC